MEIDDQTETCGNPGFCFHCLHHSEGLSWQGIIHCSVRSGVCVQEDMGHELEHMLVGLHMCVERRAGRNLEKHANVAGNKDPAGLLVS